MKHLPIVALFAAWAGGCASPGPQPLPDNHPASRAASESAPDSRADLLAAEAPAATPVVPAAAAAKPAPEHLEKINRLPPEDRAAALAQAVCPVGGEPLGSMGVPRKVTVGARSFFICCKGCEAKFAADPAGVLRRLDAAAAPAKEAGR